MATVGLGAGLQGFLQGAMDFTKIYMAFQQMQNEKEYKDRLFGLQQQEFDLNKQQFDLNKSIREEQLARERSKFEQELNNKNLIKGLFTDKVVRNLDGAAGLHEVENTHTPLTTGNEALDQLIAQTGDLDEAKKLAAVLPAKDKNEYSFFKVGEGVDKKGNKYASVYYFNKNTGQGEMIKVLLGQDREGMSNQDKNYTDKLLKGLDYYEKAINNVLDKLKNKTGLSIASVDDLTGDNFVYAQSQLEAMAKTDPVVKEAYTRLLKLINDRDALLIEFKKTLPIKGGNSTNKYLPLLKDDK